MKERNSEQALFRVMAYYQYMENYGAHDWDGVGICPQYWKYKGGDDIIVLNGLTLEQALSAVNGPFARELARQHEYSSNFAINQLMSLMIEHTKEPTWDEVHEAYYEHGVDIEKDPETFFNEEHFASEPIDRYDALSEQYGYLNA